MILVLVWLYIDTGSRPPTIPRNFHGNSVARTGAYLNRWRQCYQLGTLVTNPKWPPSSHQGYIFEHSVIYENERRCSLDVMKVQMANN